MNPNSILRILRANVIHGPFTSSQIIHLVHIGKIQMGDLVSIDAGPWVGVAQLWESQGFPGAQQPRNFGQLSNTGKAAPDFQSPGQMGIHGTIGSKQPESFRPQVSSSMMPSHAGIHPDQSKEPRSMFFPHYQSGQVTHPLHQFIRRYEWLLNMAQIVLVVLCMLSLFLPWYGASASVFGAGPGVASFSVSASLIGILFVPWGPISFLLNMATIVLFFVYPYRLLLTVLTGMSLLSVLGCSMFLLMLPNFSGGVGFGFDGSGVLGSTGMGLMWGYTAALLLATLALLVTGVPLLFGVEHQGLNQPRHATWHG